MESSFPLLVNLLGAIATLVIGWILAGVLAKVVRVILRRTKIDEKFSAAIGSQPGGLAFRLDRLISTVVFWIVILLAVVAALNVLSLTTVSEPLNNFLNQIFAFLPQVGGALVIASIAWIVATVVRSVLLRTTRSLSLDEKLFGKDEPDAPAGVLVGETLANVFFWLILLFFLPLVLNTLNLGSPLSPLLNLLDNLLAALPQLVKAGVIGFVGWLIARILRLITSNLLLSTGVDQFGRRFGLDAAKGAQPLSSLVGTLVFVVVLIPTAIAVLEALALPAISRPATEMLEQVLTALPRLFTALIIVAAGVIVGGFIGQLVSRMASGFGLDRIVASLGFSPAPPADGTGPAEEPSPETQSDPAGRPRRPSEVLGTVTQIGVALFAVFAATDVLGLPALTAVVSDLLVVFVRVITGVAVFAVGLYLAKLAHQLIRSSGGSHGAVVAQAARIAILTFAGAMALQQIGLAPNLVMLAFGLLFGSLAIAAAIAFGLGGQQVAAEQLRQWKQNLHEE
ncbi:mechanosensitive ion channel [Synechococcus sp. CCY 9618]|uniref:mechanosensitive ion channel n=1 Tax=Synechococcus sp. CCY 9618 TaxID=2815602 RepID=UPI001C227928|nr:mechanosensitive ion channel [Synechococcus sp. CCY 9618]